jgi:hypothetical protein
MSNRIGVDDVVELPPLPPPSPFATSEIVQALWWFHMTGILPLDPAAQEEILFHATWQAAIQLQQFRAMGGRVH